MKRILLLLSASLFVLTVNAQFKGEMHFSSMGKDRVFTVYSANTAYRYEFNENGVKGAIIVRKGSQEVIILMPQQKMAMKGSASDPMSIGNDPVASYSQYLNKGTLKTEGEELINGILCIRSALYSKEKPAKKLFTVWTCEKYDFPIKLVNHSDTGAETTMELKNPEPWVPDLKSFEIPSGYKIMGMPKMQP